MPDAPGLQVGEGRTLYANPAPLLVSRQAVFPGLARLADGTLLALFSIGQAFDSADMRAHASRSEDGGATWSDPVPLHGAGALESESLKPVVLPSGRVLATGYAFRRPDALTPIVDPATNATLPLVNRLCHSDDGGRSWSAPRAFSVEGAPLELSGPAIVLPSGRLLAAAAPFHLGASGHEGWLIASDDEGESWRRLSVFFRAPGGTVAPWECRLCHLGAGRVAVLFWAFDAARGCNLDNHLAQSEDGGESFGPVIATGIAAQASGLAALGPDRLLTLHAHREHPVSLTARILRLADGRVETLAEVPLFTGGPAAETGEGARGQFASLRFGQPGLLPLGPGRALGYCWRVDACQHVIAAWPLEFAETG